MRGINTVVAEPSLPLAQTVSISDETLSVSLSDGRTISVPLAWYPRLFHSSRRQRRNWRLIGRGKGIHWPDVEEDISVSGLIFGNSSRESRESFQAWLAAKKPIRKRKLKKPEIAGRC
jgi:hypothetical protein